MKPAAFFALLALLAASLAAPPLSGAAGQPQDEQKSAVDYSKRGFEVIFVPDGVELLEEKIMPLDAAPLEIGYNSGTRHNPRGMRMFAVAIQPGQSIRLTLRATPMTSYFMNWVLPPDRSDPLYSQLKRAADSQMTQRRPALNFKNTTKAPYQIAFHLSGLADHPYSIKVERR